MDPSEGLGCSVCPCMSSRGDICSSRVLLGCFSWWMSCSQQPQGKAGGMESSCSRDRSPDLHLVEAALWTTDGQCLLFPFSCIDCRNVFGWKIPPRVNSECLPSFNLKALKKRRGGEREREHVVSSYSSLLQMYVWFPIWVHLPSSFSCHWFSLRLSVCEQIPLYYLRSFLLEVVIPHNYLFDKANWAPLSPLQQGISPTVSAGFSNSLQHHL